MKSFFTRLHDSSPTGRSKPATRETYKLWTPPVDAEHGHIQQSATPGDIPTHPTSRPHGERRSSTRPKALQTTPVSAIDKNAANNAAAGSSNERLPELSVKPNPTAPNQYTRVPVQATVKSTSTRYKDYNDAKLYPSPTTRPSQTTRTYGVHENPSKTSRHAVSRSESTPPTAPQIWATPPIASTSRQVEERRNEPARQPQAIDPPPYLHNEEKASETVKREREKLRQKDREHDRVRGRDREVDKGREKGRGKEGESDREHFRHQGKDREVDTERDRGKSRGNEFDRDKVLTERGREKERQRDLVREEHDRDKMLDGRARDKEQRRERDRREQEMEYRRQVDMARDSDRERLEKEIRRPVDVPKDVGPPVRDREREPRRQIESRQRRERDYKLDAPNTNRERAEREGTQQEPDRARSVEPSAEAERGLERNRYLQHQAEAAKVEREAERVLELQRLKDAKVERDAERARDIKRHKEAAKAEREARAQRQTEAAKAEQEAEHAKELQHQTEAPKVEPDTDRLKDLPHQIELGRVKEPQRQAEVTRAEREPERQRQSNADRQRHLESVKVERDGVRLRHLETAKEAERLRQVDTERQRRFDAEKAEREAEITRHMEAERQRRLEAEKAEREAEQHRQLEAAKAEREAERLRQVEAERLRRFEAEREGEYMRQLEIDRQHRLEAEKAQREAERMRQAESDRQRRLEAEKAEYEAECMRQVEAERQRRLEVERAEREAETFRQAEVERQRRLEVERERMRQVEAERQRRSEFERAEREAELLRQAELERQRRLEAEKNEREAERQRRLEAAEKAERIRQAEIERQRRLEAEKTEREAERQRRLEAAEKAERIRQAEIERQRRLDTEKAEREAERLRQVEVDRQLRLEAEKAEHEAERIRQLEAERQRRLEVERAEREAERIRQEEDERQRRLDAEKVEHEAERMRQVEADRQRRLEAEVAERESERLRQVEKRRLEVERAEREAERIRQAEFERHRLLETEKAERESERRQMEAERQRLDVERAEREVQRLRQLEVAAKIEQEAEHARQQAEAAKAERDAERVRELQRKIQAVKAERELQRQAEAAWAEREAERAKGLQRHAEAVKAQSEALRARDSQRQAEDQRAERKANRGEEPQHRAENGVGERDSESANIVERQPDIFTRMKVQTERTLEPGRQAEGITSEHEAQRNRQTRTQSEIMWAERDAARRKQQRQAEDHAEREKEFREAVRAQDIQREPVNETKREARSGRLDKHDGEQAKGHQGQPDAVNHDREAEPIQERQRQAAEVKQEAEHVRQMNATWEEQAKPIQRQITQHEGEAEQVHEYHRQGEPAERVKNMQRQVEREVELSKERQRRDDFLRVEREVEHITTREAHRQMEDYHVAEGANEPQRQLEAQQASQLMMEFQRAPDAFIAELAHSEESKRAAARERDVHRVLHKVENAEGARGHMDLDNVEKVGREIAFNGTEKTQERMLEQTVVKGDIALHRPRERKDRFKDGGYNRSVHNRTAKKGIEPMPNKSSPKTKDPLDLDDIAAWRDKQHANDTIMRGHRKKDEIRHNAELSRSRTKHRDDGRFRAEVTDGEQDARRFRQHTPTNHNRHDHGLGWMSDSHETRKVPRQKIGKSVQNEDAEGSNGSPAQKFGLINKRLSEGIIDSKGIQVYHDKRPEVTQPATLGGLSYTISKALPDVPDSRHPLKTADQQQQTNVLNNSPSARAQDMLSIIPAHNDAMDIPVRREITRLKLQAQQDPTIPQNAAPISGSITSPFRSQISFQPSQQPSRTVDSTHPPIRSKSLAPRYSLELSQSTSYESRVPTSLLSSKQEHIPATTTILDSSPSIGQPTVMHQDEPVPPMKLASDAPFKTEGTGLESFGYGYEIAGSAPMLNQDQPVTDKLPDVAETVDTVVSSAPEADIVQVAPKLNTQTQVTTPFTSRRNLSGDGHIYGENITNLSPERLELKTITPISPGRDADEFKPYLLEEHLRHNSNLQSVLQQQFRENILRTEDATLANEMERAPQDSLTEFKSSDLAALTASSHPAGTPTVHSAVETTINHPAVVHQISNGHSVIAVPEMPVQTITVKAISADLSTDLPTISTLSNTQSSGSGLPVQQGISMTVVSPTAGAAWKQDDLGLSSRLIEPTLSSLYPTNLQYQTTVFTESPTSGLIKTNLPAELISKESNASGNALARQNIVVRDNLLSNIPVSTESTVKRPVQESTLTQLAVDPQTSTPPSKVSETRRPSVTALVTKQGSPLRSATRPLETANNFSPPLVSDRLANASSSSLFVPASVPVIASSLPSMTTAPRQWHDDPSSSPYMPLTAPLVQDRQWSTRQTNSLGADITPEQDQIQDKSKRSQSRLPDAQAITSDHGHPKQHSNYTNRQGQVQPTDLHGVDISYPKNDLVDGVEGNRLPNLGFYSVNFSRVLSKAVNEEIGGVSRVHVLSATIDQESEQQNAQQESADPRNHPLSNPRDQEGRLNISHVYDGASQSLQRSTEHMSMRKEDVKLVENTPNASGQSYRQHSVLPDQNAESTQQIEHPVLADLFLSPISTQVPALVAENSSSNGPQIRQRTISSSRMNFTPTDSHGYRGGPAELQDKQANPSEPPRKTLVDNKHIVGQMTAAPAPLVQQPLVESAQHKDDMRNVNTGPPKRFFSSGGDRFVHDSQTPVQKPLEVSNPIQEKETSAGFMESSRQASNNRYQPGKTQRTPSNAATENLIQAKDSTIVQPSSHSQGRTENSVTFPTRRHAEYPQKTMVEQNSEHARQEARTHVSKAFNIQISSSQTQPSRVPSSSTPMPTSDRPNASGQGAPIERITTSRQGANRLNTMDVKSSRERKMDDSSKAAVTQNQGSSTTRPMYPEGFQHRVYPQTSADSRFPNVSQVHASQVGASPMHQSSSRHQHSTSLPVSLPHPTPFYAVDNRSREELPRISTPAPNQRKTTSFLVNSVPSHVSTTSLRMRKDPSEETILLTPTSLAHSTSLKPTSSRNASDAPQPYVPHSQSSRTAPSTQTSAVAPQYQIWRPSPAAKTSDSSPKATQSQDEPNVSHSAPRKHPPPPISIPVTIHDTRHPPSHVFTPFRYLTTKRNRAVSVASLEAQDGTATNTVIGSPTASMHSTVPIQLPPIRDARLATEEWRNKEEAAAHALAKAKRRRQRPGVVFDVEEENPNEVKQRPRRVKTKGRSSSRTPGASQS